MAAAGELAVSAADAARALEMELKAVAEAVKPPSSHELWVIGSLLDALMRAAGQPRAALRETADQ